MPPLLRQPFASPPTSSELYIIFSMRRSSTTTLCSDLNRAKKHCYYELLNYGKNQTGRQWADRLGWTQAQIQSYPKEFVDRVRRTSSLQTFGYKLFPEHIPHYKLPDILDHNQTCIIYRRANVTAQYLSWKRAVDHGC